ncbi:50S ribosomal protein L16 [Blattabacterium punctulatus]|uniref:Large ribosomal subunit protein uL16 n=1 Tax=Blattabacterium punctulatus TaxID=164514 RepID=A0ABM6WMW7_9FLAO|nr:50S ribosomal protein L16 [Blattabacterium punctulatus]AWU39796.1 50S ribosomal protein L16 [Blattabacterium punctulatus]AWU40340.1 50S ribosomal protein L16 [Blattabacterium punctulatus]AWU42595.1 50S ribosomal protein L16 [Blattabacterium punctulatus]AWU43139.1 50S ribosomal protein L16 [Blattabacterium punctulatus]AWU44793.1 50S ribosomal protein L16 [Blattabacterium punctulatus]
MLQPKKTKYKKNQKGRIRGNASKGLILSRGLYGIKAMESSWITSRQLEAARVAATRYMKREGRLWINIFPDKPITKKPQEVRMGKGKGPVEFWVSIVKPGRILFEIDGVEMIIAKEALRLASQKFPIKMKFIFSKEFVE